MASLPARAFSKVVLPLPEAPMITFILPERNTADTGPMIRADLRLGRIHVGEYLVEL